MTGRAGETIRSKLGHDVVRALTAAISGRTSAFKGGTIFFVGVTVEQAQYLELEKLAAAALAVD